MADTEEAVPPIESLTGRVVAVPESRQLDLFAAMLDRRGAAVIRCPLVAIKDAPDSRPVVAWLERAIGSPPEVFVLYTGEGVNRLLGFAERAGLREPFVASLGAAKKLCRGPKPARALRNLGLDTDIPAPAPTTSGVIEALSGLELAGRRVCVQLYGSEPIPELAAFFERRNVDADSVYPYVYADQADDAQVVELIERLAGHGVDAIAFTSKSQVERLLKLARTSGLEAELAAGLDATCVAAVGPVVAETLRAAGVRVDVVPDRNFFLKPLVSALTAKLGGG